MPKIDVTMASSGSNLPGFPLRVPLWQVQNLQKHAPTGQLGRHDDQATVPHHFQQGLGLVFQTVQGFQ